MKRVMLNVLAGAVMAAAVGGCGGGDKIKMTTETDRKIYIHLAGSGTATVDWGDGSEKVTLSINDSGTSFEHTYPNKSIRTITITGENITELNCWDEKLTSLDVSKNTALKRLVCSSNQLTSLDLSKNTALTYLNCSSNQLTSLDVCKNTALTYLNCSSNQLTATALDALFGALHSNNLEEAIFSDNPGAHDFFIKNSRE